MRPRIGPVHDHERLADDHRPERTTYDRGVNSAPATRRIHLLRHAKSSWDDATLEDHDRPLAPRGQNASTRLAQWIEESDVRPELVLCSSALRARETLARLEEALGAARVVVADSLYGASVDALVARLHGLSPNLTEVLLVGHNPGLADLCQLLAQPSPERERVAEKLPTGALVTLETRVDWADLGPECATIVHLVVPRELE